MLYHILRAGSLLGAEGMQGSFRSSFGFGYDALGRRTSLARPNSVTTSYTYDNLSRLLSALHQKGSKLVESTAYTYDAAGNRLSRTEKTPGSGSKINQAVSNYSYDAIYQLTQTVLNGNTSESYTYDAVGNRLSGPSGGTYSYNNSNELTSLGSVTFAYDNNGNRTSMTNGSSTATFTWDFENRLTGVTGTQGGAFNFRYDPFGRRIYVSSSAGTIIYAYDGDNIVDQMDATGAWQSRFTHGLGVDEPLEIRQQSVPLYYHADGLGSIAAVTNASRAVAASYTYDSFGRWSVQTQIVTSPYGFTGREADNGDLHLPGPGLYYYRARYYDPSVGRFLSEDPIGLAGGGNAYTYADNRATSTFDPSGLSGIDASTSRMTDQVAAGLQRLLDLLPGDPDCLKFLCSGKTSPIDTLRDLLDFRAFGVAPIPPETDGSGNPTGMTNALSNGYVAGQAITVNTLGAFFNKSYDSAPLTTDRGRIAGGTPKAQGFILLHELAHLMNVIQPDRNEQRKVDQNDKILEKNCKKLIRALGKR